MAYVYRHIRLDKNEIFYIGISNTIDPEYRRAYSNNSRNKYWKSIVAKTKYKVEVIFDDVSWDYAKEKEIEFINLYGKKTENSGTLCNMTSGGEGTLSLKWSFDRREKIMSSIIGLKRSEASKLRMSESKKGILLSKSHKDNISKALKNKIWSETELLAKRQAPAKIVVNEQSGIFYMSANDAAIAHDINKSTLYNKLIGLRKNNTYLKYV